MTFLNDFPFRKFTSLRRKDEMILSPETIVWGTFILILMELLILLAVNPVFYRDSNDYVILTEAFHQGAYARAFPPHLPVLFTLFSGILTIFGIPSMSALLIVSGFMTAVTVFPLYGLLARLLPRRQAAWGVLLYALFPEIIHAGCAPLIDSGRFFCMMLILFLIFSMNNKFIFYRSICLGAAYAALILVRAEGILLVGIAAVIHLLFCLHQSETKRILSFSVIAGRVLLPLLVAGLLISPRLIQMRELTGYPAIDSRQVNAIQNVIGETRIKTVPPESRVPAGIDSSKGPEIQYGGGGWVTLDAKQVLNQSRFWRNFLAGFHFFYLPFSLLGVVLLISRRQWRFEFTLILLLFFLYNLLHFLLRASAGRYLLINACFMLPFTITGIAALVTYCRNRSSSLYRILLVLLTVTAIGLLIRSMRNLRDQKNRCYKTAGVPFRPGGPLDNTKRSGRNRPVVLLIGADRGFGFYGNLNIVHYSPYPQGLSLKKTVEDIVAHGVPCDYAGYWLERDVPRQIQVDAIAVYDEKWCPGSNEIEWFHEYPLSSPGKIRIYKVLRPTGKREH